MKIETDPAVVRTLCEAAREKDGTFCGLLKESEIPDAVLDAEVEKISALADRAIDCTACGNCCRELPPLLDARDMGLLSGALGMTADECARRYLRIGENEGGMFFRESPCPFFKEKKCAIYAHRPHDCRSFPHLHLGKFRSRIAQAFNNRAVCPKVFAVFEGLKEKWGTAFMSGEPVPFEKT